MTKTEKRENIARGVEYLRPHLESGARLAMSTEYVGNVGTAYTRVYLVIDDKIVNMTHACALAMGEKIKTRGGKDYIRTAGYGYSRAQHIADAVSWAVYGTDWCVNYYEI